MPVEAQTVEYSYVGNGVSTAFSFPSKFLSSSDLIVGLAGVLQTGGFTVSGAGAEFGGNVTFAVAPAAGVRVTLLRAPPASQLIDFVNGQTVLEGVLDTGLDKLTMLVQYLLRGFSRTIRLNDFDADSGAALTLPLSSARAGRLLAFDVGGNPSFVTPGAFAAVSATGIFATRTTASLADLDGGPEWITVMGLALPNDGGGGVYRRLGAAPAPVRSWHFQSADGGWWQLDASTFVSCRQMGAVGNGVANDTAALQDTLDYAAAFDVRAYLPSGVYAVPTATLTAASGVILYGGGDVSVIRRTSNAVVPLLRFSAATNSGVRDLRLDTTAGWASTSSHTVSAGSKTFTVPAGLDVTVNNPVQITSVASPGSYMLGTVTAYMGTSMTVNVTSAIGSGTFADWRFDRFDGENTGLSFEGCTNADADNVVITGRFYVGVRSLNSNGDSINECEVSGAVNRAIYVYATSGLTDGQRVTKNRVRGGGFTQYGINLNGSGGTIENVHIEGNIVDGTVFQGIEVGGSCSFVTVGGNHVDGVTGGNGIGVLVQRANGVQPTRVVVTGNTVKNVPGAGAGIYMIDVLYCSVMANAVAVCGFGVRVAQIAGGIGCQYVNVIGNNISNCTSDGIRFGAASAGLGTSHVCSGNICVANAGTGIISEGNTDRIAFAANVSMVNGAAYFTGGSNHTIAANI